MTDHPRRGVIRVASSRHASKHAQGAEWSDLTRRRPGRNRGADATCRLRVIVAQGPRGSRDDIRLCDAKGWVTRRNAIWNTAQRESDPRAGTALRLRPLGASTGAGRVHDRHGSCRHGQNRTGEIGGRGWHRTHRSQLVARSEATPITTLRVYGIAHCYLTGTRDRATSEHSPSLSIQAIGRGPRTETRRNDGMG